MEAVLIVVSILLAFAIDAWWEERQAEADRHELLVAMREDFAETGLELDPAVARAGEFATGLSGFLTAVVDGPMVPRDSLVALMKGMGEFAFFEPNLPSYASARSTGAIDLVRSPELLRALNDFDFASHIYLEMRRYAGTMFFYGPIHDVRRKMGVFELPMPGYAVGSSEAPPTPENEFAYRVVVADEVDLTDPVITSAAETMFWAHMNAWRGLRGMEIAADSVIAILDELIDE